jgi:hypothetical protein
LLTINAVENCCCSHGACCSSAPKRELDPVFESDSDEASASSTSGNDCLRSPAIRAQPENPLTRFTNGHYKPVHKRNNTAHKCGLPHVVPRLHCIHGPSPSCLANGPIDTLPHTPAIDAVKDSMVCTEREQRIVRSEPGSPLMSPSNSDYLNGPLPPLDLSATLEDYNFLQNLDSFSTSLDNEQSLFSALLSSTSIDWSHYDFLDVNNCNFAAPRAKPLHPPGSSIDQPTLTTT